MADNETDVWIPFVEPIPDNALTVFGAWWNIHVFGIGFLWIIVILYSSVSIGYLRYMKDLKQRHYLLAMNVIMIILGIDRTLCMFIDPYHAKGILHPALSYLFLSLGLPCMTSSFYLIFQSLVTATQVKPERGLHSPKVVAIIIIVHFAVSIALDLAAGFTLKSAELLLTCQGVFIAWGYTLSIMYFALFARIYKVVVTKRARLILTSIHGESSKESSSSTKTKHQDLKARPSRTSIPPGRIKLGSKLVLATAVLLFIIATLYLIGIFTIYMSNVVRGETPEPWPWWIYELLIRLHELALAWTICIAATLPVIKKVQAKKKTFKNQQSYYKERQSSDIKNKY